MGNDLSLKCSAILFDLDGVLVDSSQCVEATWRQWAARHGLDAEQAIQVAHGRRTIETVALLAPQLVVSDEVEALAASESTTTEGVYEVPGARELLASLPANVWAVVTSGVRAVATLRIRHTGLPSPPVLICADEIDRGKPDPQGYLIAAERLGFAPSHCIVVEDTRPGIEAAQAAGMKVVAVAGTHPAHELTAADVTIPRLSALRVYNAHDYLIVDSVSTSDGTRTRIRGE